MIGFDETLLTGEEADLLSALRPGMRLQRAGFAGESYGFNLMDERAPQTQQRFTEVLVHGLVERGLMVVIQGAVDWIPESRPFTVILTPQGEKVSLQVRSRTAVPRLLQVAA